ncbi:amidohydrolase family protein [Brumicola nitratireducens]|uniref:Amidohydrolase 2 n=1 Tax=Glaciecola nitratireducens (strain JCM 12485 / KCTC 12276 / FR1064) TaxID=1085623 RepID=G4QIW8_GLANF|nr:amidohydrolase family protein [Glaciecola nitratireducens]AEP28307.1 amidohydrolase 2 [Glaciecola nitratireducens FR1064]
MINIIDPHLHLFDLERGQYDWLKAESPPTWPDKKSINNSYSDTDLQKSASFSVGGYVHIEAGFDNELGHREIANVEQRASLPLRSIGFIDITLEPAEFINEFNNQAQYRSTVGIRHIIETLNSTTENALLLEQDSATSEVKRITSLLENDNSYTNLTFLQKHNGIFELQCDVNNRELVVQIFTFFQRLPNLQLVLNHAGFAPSAFDANGQANAAFDNWKLNTELLTRLPNIAVKCSGFEMVDRVYGKSQIQAVLMHCINVFGLDNVMLASNFPLCEFSVTYEHYWQQVFEVLEQMVNDGLIKAEHKKALYFDNAFRIYQFSKLR